ncbi:MAG: rhodanese-like domain-containing protein [Trichococcus sp.]
MFFKSFFDPQVAQFSYLVGCQKTGEAIIIDPLRKLDDYILAAEDEGLVITAATETHIHADYASGLRETERRLGAKLYVSDMGGDDWHYQDLPEDSVLLQDGDIISVGKVKLEVLHTPGHTPESVSFLLTDIGGGSDIPMGLFTGDFIFVGDVGRPDLLEVAAHMQGTTEIGAKELFHSLKKMADYPDHLQIWPGHGAGSACGKSLGAVPMTTLGYEKDNNWAFQHDEEASFTAALTDEQPEPPSYFAQMKKINKLDSDAYVPYPVFPLQQAGPNDRMIDLRAKEMYQVGHIERTLNIPLNKKFLSYAGWFLDYEGQVTFIGTKKDAEMAARQLQLIGFDQVRGYLDAGQIKDEKMTETITAAAFIALRQAKDLQILDVRSKSEWDKGHLPDAQRVLFGKLLEDPLPFKRDEPLYVHCQSGVRSAVAIGALEERGFKKIVNILGGYTAIEKIRNE